MSHHFKKNRAVVFTLTSNLTFAVACVIMDIRRISPEIADEIVLFHDGISEKDQGLLNAILPCRFIFYQFPPKYSSKVNPETLHYFTKMVFAKFECLKLLDDYKNILFLDYDIVIQEDISELFSPCKSGLKMIVTDTNVRAQLHEPTKNFDMEAKGVCASTFVLQDHLKDYRKMYKFCYNSIIEYGSILYMPEQAIFDFMIQKFKLKISPLDVKIYSPHPNDNELLQNAKIIHAFGQPKFWNGIFNEQWNNNYKLWLKVGGTRYKNSRIKNLLYWIKKISVGIKKYLRSQ